MEFTGNRGVDLIIDPVGGKNWKISYKCLSKMGKLIIYGDQSFVKGKSFSFITTMKEVFSMPKYRPMDLMSQNKSIMGYHLGRLAGAEDKIQTAVIALSQLVQEDKLSPVIDKIFPFTEADKAHEYIQNRKNFGKVLLDFRDQ
jgi:NADPH:quinone reductase-like Zn-dependent oxidoreductase